MGYAVKITHLQTFLTGTVATALFHCLVSFSLFQVLLYFLQSAAALRWHMERCFALGTSYSNYYCKSCRICACIRSFYLRFG